MTQPTSETLDFEAQFAKAQATEAAASLVEPWAIGLRQAPKDRSLFQQSSRCHCDSPQERSPVQFSADFTVSGLLAGVFGSKRWMAELQQRWNQKASSRTMGAPMNNPNSFPKMVTTLRSVNGCCYWETDDQSLELLRELY